MKIQRAASKLALSLAATVVVATVARAADPNLTEQYRDVSNRLIDAALADQEGYDKLAYLCDRIGNRLSGSEALTRAVSWGADLMKRDGLSNVRVIPVKVPHWVRSAESGRILEPVPRPLHMLGLGMSVGTPTGGITAEAVAVESFDELARLGREKVQGKIVVYNEPWEGYGKTVIYRGSGASRAASLGAVAALVRSATGLAMQEPHTGAMNYDPAQAKIPAAAISVEDAMMIWRLTTRGVPVKIHLEMEAHMEPDVDSGDVIGELPGRERPEEVIVMGGHLDSWDVGQGAQDDGAGMLAPYQALVLIKKLGLHPRRTIRAAFWVNEENGGRGGNAYRDWVGDRVKDHIAAIEMDGGSEAPLGFGFSPPGSRPGGRGRDRAGAAASPLPEGAAASMAVVQQIGKLLERINAGAMSAGGGGSDISPLMSQGVPGFGLQTQGGHYMDWHHSWADTLDKVNPEDFRKNIAALAVLSYVLADMPMKLTAPVAER